MDTAEKLFDKLSLSGKSAVELHSVKPDKHTSDTDDIDVYYLQISQYSRLFLILKPPNINAHTMDSFG